MKMAKRKRSGQAGAFVMDETVAEFIRRIVLRMTRLEVVQMLARWGFLPENQLQTLNVHQKKENLSQEVVQLCEENCATMKHAADLDIICDENYYFDLADFKKKFKRSLQSVLKNITISFKEYEDNAIWIRIAWGIHYAKPNQYKPTFVVYHSQTPYVFISQSRIRCNMPLLSQALLVAASYNDINEMDLRSRCLDSLKDIVFKRYSQNFQTYHLQPLQEKNIFMEKGDPRIIQEDKNEKERIRRINQEAFGSGPQPKLEIAEYKLDTVFRSDPETGILNDKAPFRCMIKFSSPHLLEALKSLAPNGMADAPLSPLLTCITQKARNYFRIRERQGAHSLPAQ
ncbi:hypothetical protein lerEdw1_000982 [Lerista edwardsae]|nr:hypothetical protein lerEdw1_000982 [Lerista edwardsae]